MNPQVDAYFQNLKAWRAELEQLRTILLECDLTEELKWGSPCYVHQKGNVAIIGELKDHCVLSFFKGALLKDPHGILEKPGANTQSGRVIPFTNTQQILDQEATLKTYIEEAIEVEKSSKKVDFKKTEEFEVPEELRARFAEDPEYKEAFEALTPGRQRGYLIHFAGAKQSHTRASRIEKHRERILEGKGLNDR